MNPSTTPAPNAATPAAAALMPSGFCHGRGDAAPSDEDGAAVGVVRILPVPDGAAVAAGAALLPAGAAVLPAGSGLLAASTGTDTSVVPPPGLSVIFVSHATLPCASTRSVR